MTLYRILYRGSLSSCNYDCSYCPFAKTQNTREELRQDAEEVERFVDWVEQTERPLGILFTPWGEAIVHSHYRQALIRLSQMPHVQRVVLQTNLSGGLDDFSTAHRGKLAFWATFHPTQIPLDRFLHRCQKLHQMRIRYSVGVVGMKEHFDAIAQLRGQLPPEVYLWINCYKRAADYYDSDDLAFLRSVDPHVEFNRVAYPSRGRACRTGHTVFSVDGRGNVRRCHFIDQQIGNIYHHDIFARLTPRPCTNDTCGCHIGYVHRTEPDLYRLFGEDVLERIPAEWPNIDPTRHTAASLKSAGGFCCTPSACRMGD